MNPSWQARERSPSKRESPGLPSMINRTFLSALPPSAGGSSSIYRAFRSALANRALLPANRTPTPYSAALMARSTKCALYYLCRSRTTKPRLNRAVNGERWDRNPGCIPRRPKSSNELANFTVLHSSEVNSPIAPCCLWLFINIRTEPLDRLANYLENKLFVIQYQHRNGTFSEEDA